MATIIRTIENALNYDISKVQIEECWNLGDAPELKIHSTAYPAKFPAFIASKAIQMAVNEGIQVKTVSDIFCGCGTVALEAKLNNVDFWGCDINPVATLITKQKPTPITWRNWRKFFRQLKVLLTSQLRMIILLLMSVFNTGLSRNNITI